MTKKPEKMAATEAAWTKGTAREALIRPVVEDDCFVVVRTPRGTATGLITAWKEVRLKKTNIKRASLDDIRKMNEAGKLANPSSPPRVRIWVRDFWADAPLTPRSVHLKLDPEVVDFFKGQGK